MDRIEFEDHVERALEGLPPEFRDRLDNVAVLVEDWPSPAQLRSVGLRHRSELLGLYDGVPITARSRDHVWGAPDTITIFRMPIQAICCSAQEVEDQIRETVIHEIAHHFGISDEQLDSMQGPRAEE